MSEAETIDLFLEVFTGLEIIAEQVELLQCVFGEEEELIQVSLSARDEPTSA